MTARGVPTSLAEVVTSGLCTGCGLCASLAGPAKIRMGINAAGNSRPEFLSPLDAATEKQSLAACPGATLIGPGRPSGASVTAAWGPVRELHRSWATEEPVRYRAAAGGTLTSLARFLLTSGEVDAVLHVKASTTTPWLTDAHVSTTPEAVLEGAQSRYGPAAPLIHVKQLLDDGTRFAVVAKPCDISAIRALGRVDPRVDAQIPYLLTIFCGGIHHAGVPRQIIGHHQVQEEDVETFRYRGNGWPGPLHVRTKAGSTHDLTYHEAWLSGEHPWRYDMQFRCKICPDAIGESADLSAPDGWVLKDGKPIHDEAPGVNALVVRTERGRQLVSRAVAAGVLALAPLSIDELEQMHVNHLDRKVGTPAQMLAMRVTGSRRPAVTGYRPLSALRRAGFRMSWRQFTGTVRRVRRGDNREQLM
jgi:coenzyme F420 hydrogenase subunit beta